MSKELKPCPFCGGEAILFLDVMAGCETCNSDGDLYETRAEAIAAWNTRVPSPEVTALVEAAKDMLSGWFYIRYHYGDLDSVRWDRAQNSVTEALAPFTSPQE